MKNNTRNTSVLFALFMVIFIDSMGMSMSFTLFAPLFSTTQASIVSPVISATIRDILYGLCMSIYPAMMFFGAPILGDLSDQIGRKKVITMCLVGEAVGMAICGIGVNLHSVSLLIVGRLVAGLMAASLATAQAAIIDISDNKSKMLNISLIMFANTFGFVIGPMIGGYLTDNHLVSWFNLSTPFYATAGIAVMNAVILMMVFHETFVIKTKQAIKPLKGFVSLVDAYRNKMIRTISSVYFFNILGWMVYIQLIGLYLVEVYHYSPERLGHFISWISLIMSISMLLIVRLLLKKFKPHQILFIALVLSIIGIVISLIPTINALWIAVIPLATGVGLAYSSVLTLFSNAVDETKQGWVMGVSTSVIAVAGAVSGIMTGVLTSISYHLTFISIAFFWVISLLLFVCFKSRKNNV